MTYDAILSALADPTRRAVLDRLRGGPLPVGRIAEAMPVTRPAVSQHLKVLHGAGLVAYESRGTRNVYRLAPGGAAPLADWLGELRPAPPEGALSLHLRLAPAEAWRLFLDDLPTWWPVGRLSVSAMESGALPMAVTVDPAPGGAIRETTFDGTTHDWATVARATAPEELVLDWALDAPGEVTVRFAPEGGGCRVGLVPPPGAEAFWELALIERYGAAARASLSNF